MRAPDLVTDRLHLTGHRLDDMADCLALWSDPDVTRFIGGKPFSESEVWARLLRYVGHWALMGFGYWVVRARSDRRFLGEVGIADARRPITPAFGTTPEAGWAFLPSAQGQGFAREAVGALTHWCDQQGMARTVCMIDPSNHASLRLADALGYRRYAETPYQDAPVILLERHRGEVDQTEP